MNIINFFPVLIFLLSSGTAHTFDIFSHNENAVNFLKFSPQSDTNEVDILKCKIEEPEECDSEPVLQNLNSQSIQIINDRLEELSVNLGAAAGLIIGGSIAGCIGGVAIGTTIGIVVGEFAGGLIGAMGGCVVGGGASFGSLFLKTYLDNRRIEGIGRGLSRTGSVYQGTIEEAINILQSVSPEENLPVDLNVN